MFPMSISFNAGSDGCGHVSFFCLHRLMRDPMVVGMFLVSVSTDGCGHISCFCLYRLTRDPMVVGMFLVSVHVLYYM